MRFNFGFALALAAMSAAAWISPFAPDAALARACFQPDESKLERHQHYRSRRDDCDVHGPAKSRDGTKPEGASAKCRDGTWSFSHTRSGTCSRHGGVERWESGGLMGPIRVATGTRVRGFGGLAHPLDGSRVPSPARAGTARSVIGRVLRPVQLCDRA